MTAMRHSCLLANMAKVLAIQTQNWALHSWCCLRSLLTMLLSTGIAIWRRALSDDIFLLLPSVCWLVGGGMAGWAGFAHIVCLAMTGWYKRKPNSKTTISHILCSCVGLVFLLVSPIWYIQCAYVHMNSSIADWSVGMWLKTVSSLIGTWCLLCTFFITKSTTAEQELFIMCCNAVVLILPMLAIIAAW